MEIINYLFELDVIIDNQYKPCFFNKTIVGILFLV